jgi:photosystem II stability/assembly factor-like uncharacterized protein
MIFKALSLGAFSLLCIGCDTVHNHYEVKEGSADTLVRKDTLVIRDTVVLEPPPSFSVRTSGTTELLLDVLWTGEKHVAVGGEGNLWVSSSSGFAWLKKPSGVADTLLRSIAKNDSGYVVVGMNGKILTSKDLDAWESHDVTVNQLNRVIWTGERFLIAAGSSRLLTSVDGKTWEIHNATAVPAGTDSRAASCPCIFYGSVWTGTRFVVVGTNGTILTAATDMTYALKVSSTTSTLYSVAWNPVSQALIAVGNNGIILKSTDRGDTWAPQASGVDVHLYSVTWTGQDFWAVGEQGTVLSSRDGATWMEHDSGIRQDYFSAVSWSGERLFMVGTRGVIVTYKPRL